MSAPAPAPMSGAGDAARVALVGFMGAGKTTAARTLGPGAVDVDQLIEARAGRSIQEIFAAEGQAAFRELEERTALEVLGDPTVPVVALGGGGVRSPAVRAALRSGPRTVWLDVDCDEAWARVSADPSGRPLATDPDRFKALHAERLSQYDEIADVVVPGSRSEDLATVLAACAGVPAKGAKVLWAATESGDYPVYIGSGLLTREHFWPAQVSGRRVVISDHTVASRYGALIEPVLAEIRVMPGEQSKTVAHADIVWSEMARRGVNRGDIAVALGGGVVGDLGGFCAATYQRGMRVVHVPTTLVAQVDSAYGGKTGVDLAEAKNYVGAFHQPAAVIADTAILASLPDAELACGYAEVVKTALIAGGALWELVRGGAAPDDPKVIAGCALTKLRVVAGDERDSGPRQLLNLGHTIGHAIETATGYARYRHGEAVGLGLLAALRLSGADSLRLEVLELLGAQGLPTRLTGVALEQVIFSTAADKKRVGEGPVPFVLCSEPGHATYGHALGPADVRAAVAELLQ